MQSDPYRYFRPEARELLQRLNQGVLALERGEAAAASIGELLRVTHTLKGAARVVRHARIAELAHAIEDTLTPVRERGSTATPDEIDEVLRIIDAIGALVTELSSPERRPVETQSPAPNDELVLTVRAEIAELDQLLDGLSGATAQLGVVRKSFGVLEQARRHTDVLWREATSPRAQGAALSTKRPAPMIVNLAEGLRESIATLEQDLSTSIEALGREIRQAKHLAEQLRLLPAKSLFPGLQRTARDAARETARQIELATAGGEIRLDAHVLAGVQPALTQLVRNAVVHGIESADERLAAGKDAAGRIQIEVSRRGDRVAFRCRDDGRGVDLPAVRRAAVRKGLFGANDTPPNDEILIDRLLEGGLTTTPEVSQVSGRGIGLDLVRETANRLGGALTLQTHRGTGTIVELTVPVSLSSVQALLVEVAGITVAVPIAAAKATLRVTASDLSRSNRGWVIAHGGRPIPFAPLYECLGLPAAAHNGKAWPTVIIGTGELLAAVGADRLRSIENIVVQQLPPFTPASAVIAGASLDADCVPRLVIDPSELVALVARSEHDPEAPVRTSPAPILIIDDSLTTRMLEQSILESAGYDADVAASAEEAFEKAAMRRYSLFLVDIEMPGIDGFTFVERTRADPSLRNIPSILVTSRGSLADRQRGEQAGARAFVSKGEFDQNDLLRLIRKFVADREAWS